MASNQYSVGVIGYGLSAKVFHIPLISVVPEFKLYAIVQRRYASAPPSLDFLADLQWNEVPNLKMMPSKIMQESRTIEALMTCSKIPPLTWL